jgi:hypothetical protein
MKEKVTVTFNDIYVSDIKTSNSGGLIYAVETTNPATSSLVKFVDTNLATLTFQDIESKSHGGAFFLDHQSLNIEMN